jgi:sugar phosphate isomerase/epimerase
MLSEVRQAGYDGVEMAIHPNRLRQVDLISLLQKHKLALMGISRGSIHEKIEFVQWFRETLQERFTGMNAPDRKTIDPGPQYPYVYLDEATDLHFTMSHPDITFALHPHMFKSVQTLQEATVYLERYTQLRFLPDTAHLRIAGDDPEEAVKQHFNRLVGVHVKDWIAEYGRSYQFYARGFVDLGDGDCARHVKNVVMWLTDKKYDGWLVVEKDRAATAPFEDAQKNRRWLKNELRV